MMIVGVALAAMLTVGRGGVTWNVLSSEVALGVPKHSSLEIKKVVSNETGDVVSLAMDGETVKLVAFSGSEEKSMDVTGYGGELIEIEEASEPQKIKISTNDVGFVISQNGVSAVTNYGIYIDPVGRELSVDTPAGRQFLAVLPYEAVSGLIKANVIGEIGDEGKVELLAGEEGLSYLVSGKKVLVIGKFLSFDVPVAAKVSASNGRVLDVDQPLWLAVLGYLFS